LVHQSGIWNLKYETSNFYRCKFSVSPPVPAKKEKMNPVIEFIALKVNGWGGWTRTNACGSQSPVPYQLGYAPVVQDKVYQAVKRLSRAVESRTNARGEKIIFLFNFSLFLWGKTKNQSKRPHPGPLLPKPFQRGRFTGEGVIAGNSGPLMDSFECSKDRRLFPAVHPSPLNLIFETTASERGRG
jgi:hypothetical protein